jgi:hypothetical protein
MASRASSESAEQASKANLPSSMRARSVKGAITGWGAETESASRRPSGAMRASSDSRRRWSSGESEMASMETPPGATEILARGRTSRAFMA